MHGRTRQLEPDEIWKPVTGAPLYEISNMGRVRSWAKPGCHGPSRGQRARSHHAVAPQWNGRPSLRYLRVVIAGRPIRVHRLVLDAFVGPCPEGYHGAHLNGDSGDNRLVNLAWVTPAENVAHKERHGTDRRTILKTRPEIQPRGERVWTAKITRSQADEIRSSGEKTMVLMARFGLSRTQIYRIRKGLRWAS
jgi:hypothetical protein